MKMWSGDSGLDPDFERWQRSFPFDKRLLSHELAASLAHARGLQRIGVLTPTEFEKIRQGLETIGQHVIADPKFLDDSDAEDVHHFVEKQLVSLVGELGYKLHAGRSRNEQIATDLRLFVRGAIDEIQRELTRLLAGFLARAEQAGDAAMPAYTHLQRAEPVLVAHWLLAYFEMFHRDWTRLTDCRARVNLCPLGSGAIAGATLPLDRDAIATELGFDAPTANSLDATSDRDFTIECTQTLSLVALHLSRWAEELILFSTKEFGFVIQPEAYSTGSSALPQKRNPDALELIRGKAGAVIGNAATLMIALKGLPLAYNKDLQETQQPVFAAADTTLECARIAAGFMEQASFDVARMNKAAQTGYLNAMAAATYLAKKGVPFRRAHHIVGEAIRLAMKKNVELEGLTLDELREFSPEFDRDIYQHLKLKAVLDCHDVPGGTARAWVKQALAEATQKLNSIRGEVHAHA
jgi:argininosuccinate lyase